MTSTSRTNGIEMRVMQCPEPISICNLNISYVIHHSQVEEGSLFYSVHLRSISFLDRYEFNRNLNQ